MNICDIGILISNKKIHQEGISNALLEFMALGKPVIANDNGGNSELIDTDRNGFILKNDTYMAVKESIISLLDNEKLRSRFGSESKAIVKEKFAIKRMIDLFIQEYVMLMNNNSSNKNK